MKEITTYKKNSVRLIEFIVTQRKEDNNIEANYDTYRKLEKLIDDMKSLLDKIYTMNQNKVEEKFTGLYNVKSILDFEKEKVNKKLKMETNKDNYKYYYKYFYMIEEFLNLYEGNDL